MVIAPVLTLGGSPGLGAFAVPEDRRKLGPLLAQAVKRKLLELLRQQDHVGYRVLLNLQNVHLRGFGVEAIRDLIPNFEANSFETSSPSSRAVASFLHQMGYQRINQADGQGWSPLHYACLGGDPVLVQSLLEQRADVKRLTRSVEGQPLVEMPPFVSALAIAVSLKHHEAARLLIGARARVDAGLVTPAICFAAMVNNPEGIRMLCSAGSSLDSANLLGLTTLELAAAYGAMEAIEEILMQARHRPHHPNLSRALYCAMVFRGGTAEVVHRLTELRADVNYQWTQPVMSLWGFYTGFQALKHRLGKVTTSTRVFSELAGSTPLMAAVKSGQYEGAAALIAGGANVDLRNHHNRTAADWAKEYPVPAFLAQALDGLPSECERISSMALANTCIEL